jgi:hypothetical protein
MVEFGTLRRGRDKVSFALRMTEKNYERIITRSGSTRLHPLTLAIEQASCPVNR